MVKSACEDGEMDSIYGFMPIVGPALLAGRMANRWFAGDGASEKGGASGDVSDDGSYANKFNAEAASYRSNFLAEEQAHRDGFLKGEQDHRDGFLADANNYKAEFLKRMYGEKTAAPKKGSGKVEAYDEGAGKSKAKKDNYDAKNVKDEDSDGSEKSEERSEKSGDLEKRAGNKDKNSGASEAKGSNYEAILAEFKKEYDALISEIKATYGKNSVSREGREKSVSETYAGSGKGNKESKNRGKKSGSKKSNLEEIAESGAKKETKRKGKGYEGTAAGDNYDTEVTGEQGEVAGGLEGVASKRSGSTNTNEDTQDKRKTYTVSNDFLKICNEVQAIYGSKTERDLFEGVLMDIGKNYFPDRDNFDEMTNYKKGFFVALKEEVGKMKGNDVEKFDDLVVEKMRNKIGPKLCDHYSDVVYIRAKSLRHNFDRVRRDSNEVVKGIGLDNFGIPIIQLESDSNNENVPRIKYELDSGKTNKIVRDMKNEGGFNFNIFYEEMNKAFPGDKVIRLS